MPSTHRLTALFAATAAVAALAASAALPAAAQAVYRNVGPDGRVTYSDKPSPTAQPRAGVSTVNSGPATGGPALPFELREVAQRYPVTLYTSKDCAPCASARNLLLQRGIPFSERTVETADDAAALQRLSGGSTLPFATIGGQQLPGFSDAEYSQYLNAAGYPKASQLPPGYRPPAATPLVAVREAPASAAAGTAPVRPAEAPSAPAQAAPSRADRRNNPAGIQF